MGAPTKSYDAIPADMTSLSDAFEAYFRKVTPNWNELSDRVEALAVGVPATDDLSAHDNERDAATNALHSDRGAAEQSFREALARGELVPLIRDPESGELLKILGKLSWLRPPNGLRPTGISDDFVSVGDPIAPGPRAIIRGSLRPLFFETDAFRQWLSPDVPQSITAPQLRPLPAISPTLPEKQAHVARAMHAIWGKEGGIPCALSRGQIARQVEKQMRASVSDDTIGRVLAKTKTTG